MPSILFVGVVVMVSMVLCLNGTMIVFLEHGMWYVAVGNDLQGTIVAGKLFFGNNIRWMIMKVCIHAGYSLHKIRNGAYIMRNDHDGHFFVELL
mgnify:CR=1 FL=1